jgi:hypothetical protein
MVLRLGNMSVDTEHREDAVPYVRLQRVRRKDSPSTTTIKQVKFEVSCVALVIGLLVVYEIAQKLF